MNITVEASVRKVSLDCQRPQNLKDGTLDALVTPLKVKPEGVPVEEVESQFKCFKKARGKNIKMRKLKLPANAVADSGRAWLHLTGDMMAPSLDNLGNLVRISLLLN